jgi:6-pyruvoyltetrahydropterin/6-carboxytetrahydropterin synthase
MYIIRISDSFSSAHSLRGYEGRCENLHGHNWKVELELHYKALNRLGISMDFRDAKKALRDVLAHYDHTNLNTLPEFETQNPSAENIARTTHERLIARLSETPEGAPEKIRVFVWESEGSCCGYED